MLKENIMYRQSSLFIGAIFVFESTLYGGETLVIGLCFCQWDLSLLLIEPRVCVCAQNLINFCPYTFISNPNVPKILFA